ncbi:hypothetical protein AC1031_005742 [Aphanomyces cochlioides]|nr:hypothetical protein AC1031_005742 [Aphanomyces cochlioides]
MHDIDVHFGRVCNLATGVKYCPCHWFFSTSGLVAKYNWVSTPFSSAVPNDRMYKLSKKPSDLLTQSGNWKEPVTCTRDPDPKLTCEGFFQKNEWQGQYFTPIAKLTKATDLSRDPEQVDRVWKWTNDVIARVLGKQQ